MRKDLREQERRDREEKWKKGEEKRELEDL